MTIRRALYGPAAVMIMIFTLLSGGIKASADDLTIKDTAGTAMETDICDDEPEDVKELSPDEEQVSTADDIEESAAEEETGDGDDPEIGPAADDEEDESETGYEEDDAGKKIKITDADVVLKKNIYPYTGEKIVPKIEVSVTVKGKPVKLKKNRDFTVNASKNIHPGKAAVTVSGMGNYSGNVTKTFKIRLDVPELVSATDEGKYVSVKWDIPKGNPDGIQIQCSKDDGFRSKVQTIFVYDKEARSEIIEDLKKDKDYFVRIRSFCRPKHKIYYSKWTAPMEVSYGADIKELTITNKPESMIVGEKIALDVEIRPRHLKGMGITWKSSNEKVATVDPSGKVTALHSGVARITAACKGKKDSCRIKVNIEGIITIIDDDGDKAYLKKLLPIVKEKKVNISTAVVPTWPDKKKKFMTWDEIAQCSQSGAEVLCHTLKHRGPDETRAMKQQEIRKEYSKAQKMMEEHGYNGDILVYSRSTGRIKRAQKAASKVFKCGIYCSGFSVNTYRSDPYYLKRYKLEPYLADHPKEIREWIDDTKENGGWMIWSIHCATDAVTDKALDNLRDLIDYARKQGVEIVTAAEGYERFAGN